MSTQIVETEVSQKTQKSKHSLLPVLVALFIVSYGLLTLLVVEQGRTIDAQRSLIHDLFSDSSELIALKGKLAKEHNAVPKVKGGNAAPTQAPHAETPAPAQRSNQGKTSVSDDSAKLRKVHPVKPPKTQDDDPDIRRMNVSI